MHYNWRKEDGDGPPELSEPTRFFDAPYKKLEESYWDSNINAKTLKDGKISMDRLF